MKLSNPTGRSTECRRLQVGSAVLFFSYETLIGCRAWDGSYYRRANEWGPTTGRHFNECGLQDATVCDEEYLEAVAATALYQSTLILSAVRTEAGQGWGA